MGRQPWAARRAPVPHPVSTTSPPSPCTCFTLPSCSCTSRCTPYVTGHLSYIRSTLAPSSCSIRSFLRPQPKPETRCGCPAAESGLSVAFPDALPYYIEYLTYHVAGWERSESTLEVRVHVYGKIDYLTKTTCSVEGKQVPYVFKTDHVEFPASVADCARAGNLT